MDGSNSVVIATGVREGWDILTDFKNSEIIWSDGPSNEIESSNFDGDDRKLVLSCPYPWGMALGKDRIIWGERNSYKLRSSTLTGEDIITLYTGTSEVTDVEIVPSYGLPYNLENHCAGHKCDKVCVLTVNSFRCIN